MDNSVIPQAEKGWTQARFFYSNGESSSQVENLLPKMTGNINRAVGIRLPLSIGWKTSLTSDLEAIFPELPGLC